MPLTPATLVHLGGRSGGPNICSYTNGVADRLNVNDIIIAIDTAAPTIDVLVVSALAPAVTVVNGT